MENSDWNDLILGLRNGDQDACTQFWNQFGEQLQGIAQTRISDRLQRRIGSDDIVQSACRTFFRRISAGQFDVPDADALWRLMCAIVLTKVKRAARDHGRQKRGMNAEQYIDASSDQSQGGFQLEADATTPLDAAMFSDQMDNLLANLSSIECQILDMKLQNHTSEEIAEAINCSERTVRRLTAQIRKRWTVMFDESIE
jgi:RNA polymerase sigma factor (sigma-70 family)